MSARLPLVAVEDLSFEYAPGVALLEHVSARLDAGCLCALIGPNAAGKTTLLKLLVGALAPRSGSVRLEGREVRRLSAAGRARAIAYVPQQASVGFAFSVAEVVAMGRYALAPQPDAVSAALAECELDRLASRPYVELSAGQQQRVLLARALAQSTGDGKLILLDEPVSAMDLAHTHATLRCLRNLTARGLCVIVILQDLNLTARYADVVWLLDQGKLAASGPWQSVLWPEILEPVYGVRLARLEAPGATSGGGRPRFDVVGDP